MPPKTTRSLQDPTIKTPAALTLPRMSFEYTTMVYAPDRHLNKMGRKIVGGSDTSHMKAAFNPVPYDFSFNLYINVKNTQAFLDDPDYELVARWHKEIQPQPTT